MRKFLQVFPILLFPYIIIFLLISIFTGLSDTFFSDDPSPLLFIIIGGYILALICSVITFITNLRKERKSQEVLHINLIIKLIHIPAYLIIFFIGFACMLTIITFGFTIIFMIFDGMTIILSGLIGLSGIMRGFREGKINYATAVINGIFQFVFCADIISSLFMYRKVKANNLKE